MVLEMLLTTNLLTIINKIKLFHKRWSEQNQISFLPQSEHKHSFNNDGGKYIDLGVQEARHDVFSGFCTINKKVCELIGDNDSSKNFVNRKRVEYFKLPMEIRQGSYEVVIEICYVPIFY